MGLPQQTPRMAGGGLEAGKHKDGDPAVAFWDIRRTCNVSPSHSDGYPIVWRLGASI